MIPTWSSFSGCNIIQLCLLLSLAWRSTFLKYLWTIMHQLHFKSAPSSSTQTDCSCLLWKFSNSHPCIKEGWDNLRTLLMHFISINVLLAQDQKDVGKSEFLNESNFFFSSSHPQGHTPLYDYRSILRLRSPKRNVPGSRWAGGKLKWSRNLRGEHKSGSIYWWIYLMYLLFSVLQDCCMGICMLSVLFQCSVHKREREKEREPTCYIQNSCVLFLIIVEI